MAYLTLMFKIRTITDVFRIKKELNQCFRLLFLALIIFSLLLLFGWINDQDMNSAPMACFQALITSSTAGLVCYVSVYYITTKGKHRIYSAFGKISEWTEPLMKYMHNNDDFFQELTLCEIIENRIGFEAFMLHLVDEFSVENLLFVVEVQQFRNTLDFTQSELEVMEESFVPALNIDWLPLADNLTDSSLFSFVLSDKYCFLNYRSMEKSCLYLWEVYM